MENLIIYSIIFFIILIALVILYISLNPLEIKDKKKETFVDYEEDVIVVKEPTDFQGTAGEHYEVRLIPNSNDKVIIFRKNSAIRFPDNFTNCSILVVGGGAGGGNTDAGGGGAGGLIFIPNYTFTTGNYSIIIGNGGVGYTGSGSLGQLIAAGNNGGDTIISKDSINLLIAKGGGGGGVGYTGQISARPGGSGGGAGSSMNNNNRIGALSTQVGSSATVSGDSLTYGYGNKGGNNNGSKGGAGGGGAGEIGKDNTDTLRRGQGGNGLAAISVNGTIYNFKNIFNLNNIGHHHTDGNVYFAGGGGGGHYANYSTGGNILGGLGGGGQGDYVYAHGKNYGGPALPNTGGGGGGGGGGAAPGGAGGSGVVIIRYTPIVVQPPPYSNRNASSAISNVISSCIANVLTDNPRNEPFDVKTAHGITGSDENYVQSASTNDNTVQYTVKFSSYANPNKSPLYLFDYDNTIRNNTGVEFKERRYNQSSGHFISSVPPLDIIFRDPRNPANTINNRSTTEIPDNEKIRGEWVSIKFPTIFNLIGCSFIANIGWENKAPGSYIILGRNTTTNSAEPYTKIIGYTRGPLSDDTGRMSWENYNNADCEYAICLRDNTGSYNEYLFVFPRLAYTDKRENVRAGHQLHFKEIRLIQRAIQDDYSSL